MEEVTIEDLRPEVKAFAIAMEKKLRKKDHKGGWQNEPIGYLFEGIEREKDELERATGWDRTAALEEAVDVANFAMMIFDNISNGRDF